MKKPVLDPDVADVAPNEPVLTIYDEQYRVACWPLLDAETDGVDWKEVPGICCITIRSRARARSRSIRSPFRAQNG
ncbi:DUF2285 domain-containing protein [Bradyrhizobium erythrophlei]|uniref:DUF2285 domain-containing protein n=1 Tax=Bradyrhizobium erythrophlei TaxID=1437360 RepID=UPI0035EFBB82